MEKEKWMELCRLYERNRKGLRFTARFCFEDGKGRIGFKNLDSKYQKSVAKLVMAIIKDAPVFFKDLTTYPSYARKEDVESQVALHVAECTEHIQMYVQLLLDEGLEKAIEVFQAKQILIQFAYEAGHMTYRDGYWTAPNGEVYRDGAFHDVSGKPYFTFYSSVWDLLLTDGKEEEEKEGKA